MFAVGVITFVLATIHICKFLHLSLVLRAKGHSNQLHADDARIRGSQFSCGRSSWLSRRHLSMGSRFRKCNLCNAKHSGGFSRGAYPVRYNYSISYGVQVYRCWMLWNRNFRVVCIPFLMVLGSTGTHFLTSIPMKPPNHFLSDRIHGVLRINQRSAGIYGIR